MLDRTLAPEYSKVKYQSLPKVLSTATSQGIPVHYLSTPDQVIKLELKLMSGIWFEKNLSESWFTTKMMMEGSKKKSGKELAAAFELLGAFIEIDPGFDDINISVYGLKKNFKDVITLLQEILLEPAYESESLETLKKVRKNEIRQNDAKSGMLASKRIRKAVFGELHPYGKGLTELDIDEIDITKVCNYHSKKLFRQPELFISGGVDDDLIDHIKGEFQLGLTVSSQLEKTQINGEKEIYEERADALQSSIRVGWTIPDRKDIGYFDYSIAGTILGGYFGSRLMKNIREEKGYTYGISSYPIHLRNASFGIIATDVKSEYTNATLDEIEKEIDLLRQGKIMEDEIQMVINYLGGKFQASVSTPFQVMSKFQTIHKSGLSENYFEHYYEALNSFDVTKLQDSIERHFDLNVASLAIVGKR